MTNTTASRVEVALSSLRSEYAEEFSSLEEDTEHRTQSQHVEEELQRFCRHYAASEDVAPAELPPAFCRPILSDQPHAYPCRSTHDPLPAPPSRWPQAPVMLRPSPRSQTQIRGIRHAASTEYRNYAGFCAGCLLPINNGTEAPGKSLVIDFETKYFVGTLLLRIRGVPPRESDTPGQNEADYFRGKKRQFQGVVKGRFKTELPMSRCVTGQAFDRPGGKLPARWIVSSVIKFMSALAPQLEATVDGKTPRFLSPLAATAQSVLRYDVTDAPRPATERTTAEETDRFWRCKVCEGAAVDIEGKIEEPQADSPRSVLPQVPGYTPDRCSALTSDRVAARQLARKKALNRVSARQMQDPCFSTDKEYCFEFYQHLLSFGETFGLDMGRPIGKVGLATTLNGQPLKFMAAFRDGDASDQRLEPLWSFDIWHESLYPYAEAHYKNGNS